MQLQNLKAGPVHIPGRGKPDVPEQPGQHLVRRRVRQGNPAEEDEFLFMFPLDRRPEMTYDKSGCYGAPFRRAPPFTFSFIHKI